MRFIFVPAGVEKTKIKEHIKAGGGTEGYLIIVLC